MRDNNVLLIEAGGSGRFDPTLKVPMMTALLLRGNRHAWRYQTGPEPGLNNRMIDQPRGKVLGGTSAINGMVYVRGLPIDYDSWAQAGMSGWSYDQVLPHFLKSERFFGPGDPTHHGHSGELAVSRREIPVSPLADAFIQAGLAAGYPECSDFNAPDAEGFGRYHFTTRAGRRQTTASAFLDNRPNLTIATGYEVNRLTIENGRAAAVELDHRTIQTEGEIILAAGAIGSPAILLRSGIGPADELKALGIPPGHDAPEVGRNLQDHVIIRVGHICQTDTTLHHLTRPDRAAWAFLQASLLGKGPMNVFPLETGAYLKGPGQDVPNLQSHFIPALSSATLRFNPFRQPANEAPGYLANASLMRPQSRGRLKLTSTDPKAAPDIRLNYLTEPSDLEQLIDAVEILREIFAQKPFDPHRGPELMPGLDTKSRAQIATWIRQTASTVYHLTGSCRMGPDDRAVVDPELRVLGIQNLRIADASIFPSIPSTNTAAPTMMVAEKAAAIIRGEEQITWHR